MLEELFVVESNSKVNYLDEDRLLLGSIIQQALRDAILIQCPRPLEVLRRLSKVRRKNKKNKRLKKIKIKEREIWAAHARYFLSAENKLFCYYCGILGYDPEWIAKKAWAVIKEEDKRYTVAKDKRFSRIKKSAKKPVKKKR